MKSTDRYIAYHGRYARWAMDWKKYGPGYDYPRCVLYHQLLKIRKEHGSKEALEFVHYLHWLGVHPARKVKRG